MENTEEFNKKELEEIKESGNYNFQKKSKIPEDALFPIRQEEFNLSEKMGWVNSYEIRNEEDCHSSHKQKIFEIEDVKEFIEKETELIVLLVGKTISWAEFKKRRLKLVGDNLK